MAETWRENREHADYDRVGELGSGSTEKTMLKKFNFILSAVGNH
jgi:hypothetical protein